MEQSALRRLRDLLLKSRILTVAVLVDGKPAAGLLPYALRPDFSAAMVHASSMARHTRGLTEGAPFSLVIHQPDAPEDDPLATVRVILEGEVHVLSQDTPDYEEGRAAFLERFPQSEITFSLADFSLFELRFQNGRYVEGFATASRVTGEDLRRMARA